MGFSLKMFKTHVADICDMADAVADISDADLGLLASAVHNEQQRRIQRKKEPDPMECPRCGKDLKRRKSQHGEFLGCLGFPVCRYTRDVPPTTVFDEPLCGIRLDEFSLKGERLYRERGNNDVEVDRAAGALVKIGEKFYSVESIVEKLKNAPK